MGLLAPRSGGAGVSGAKRLRHVFAGGAVRTYSLHLPVGYVPGVPVPLVVNLHGTASNALEHERVSGMSRLADAEGFAVVYPNALGSPPMWRIGPCAEGRRDLAFLCELVEHLRAGLSIDPRRIYAAGLSNGAGMANRMACEMPDLIAALGTVSGAYPYWDECQPARPVPVIAFHGTADRQVPYGGMGTALPPIRVWAAEWARRNRCDPTPVVVYRRNRIVGEAWRDGEGRDWVILYTVEGGGHCWPGSPGGPPGAICAASLMWDFFAAHPLPHTADPSPVYAVRPAA